MRTLRDPETGCPWDIEQDFASIAPYTIEEAYEVAGAIEAMDPNAIKDELGDLLFQVVFYTQMASEKGWFEFSDVVEAISDKMLRRHPHVFADVNIESADQQATAWEAIKAKERSDSGDTSALAGISSGLPEWLRAVKLQKRAARIGFDWENTAQVFPKVSEELNELEQAFEQEQPDAIEDEFGDLLFSMLNLSRHLKIDAGRALRRANRKFESRFRSLEKLAAKQRINLETADLVQMDNLWEAVKSDNT